jgi:hypothetical protein
MSNAVRGGNERLDLFKGGRSLIYPVTRSFMSRGLPARAFGPVVPEADYSR